MHPICRTVVRILAASLGAGLLIHTHALAADPQPYPTRIIRIVVPYPPGGTNDVLARIIAPPLAASLGRSVIVENKPGGNSSIGCEYVAKAAPDGHTLLLGGQATHSANPYLLDRPSYNALSDFTPVALLGVINGVLVVHPSLPAYSLQELIGHAKANPGKLNFGHPGVGTNISMAGELFKMRTGVNIVSIAYKGGAQANAALLAGEIQMIFANTASVAHWVRAGSLRALGVTALQRDPLLPEVAPIAEQGIPGYEMTTWLGLFLPANTPAPVVTKLNAEVRTIVASAEVGRKLMDLGATPLDLTPGQFSEYVKQSNETIGALIRGANLKPN